MGVLFFIGLIPTSSASSSPKNERIEASTSSGKEKDSGSGKSLDKEKERKEDDGTSSNESQVEKNKEEKQLKQDINTYIIESYKAQANKIIKDLSVKLTKGIPDNNQRKEAYKKIRSSLELRLKRTELLDMSEAKKQILIEYLKHLLTLLDKKIDELSS